MTADIYRHLAPRFATRAAKRGRAASYVGGSWDDPMRPGHRMTRGDRATHPNLLGVLAWAEIKGLNPTVSWTTPRSKERVRINPWRNGAVSARAFLEELSVMDPIFGGTVGQQYLKTISQKEGHQ